MNKQTIKILSLALVLAASSSVAFAQKGMERILGYCSGINW